MKNILNRGFSQLVVDALVTKVRFIIAQLTGNPNFPKPDPTLADLQTALDAVTRALTLPDPQARETAVAAARKNLEQMLDDLADNLEKTANLDPVKLATSGFDLRRETAQTGAAPDVPQNLWLKLTGTSGECQLLLGASDRATGYQVQTAADPNAGPWSDYDTFSSSRGIILKGFPRAKDLWARARALGPNNTKSAWSDPATILINERENRRAFSRRFCAKRPVNGGDDAQAFRMASWLRLSEDLLEHETTHGDLCLCSLFPNHRALLP